MTPLVLPLEIQDVIVEHLIEPRTVKALSLKEWYHGHQFSQVYRWDDFMNCRYAPQDPASPRQSSTRPYGRDNGRCFTFSSLAHVWKMRLVSRSWNASATRLIRKQLWVSASIEDRAGLVRLLDLFAPKPDESGRSRCSPTHLLRGLQISSLTHTLSFIRHYPRGGGLDSLPVFRDVPLSTRRGWSGREPIDMHPDKSLENKMLRGFFDGIDKVEAFAVSLPAASTEYDGWETWVDCYDTRSLDAAIGTLIHGLKSPAFQHLVDLRLTVPCTHHVGQLAAEMADALKQQLKCLYVEIVDGSGPGGSKEYSYEDEHDEDMETSAYQDGTLSDVEDSGYPPSNLQAQYPNREHQDEVWQFIAACPNLEALGLHCTHYLSLDRLKWKRGAKSRGLRALYLYRVYANATTLIDLLSERPTGQEFASARRVEFNEVKIYPDGGVWSTVFTWLADSCPRLEFFLAYNIGYFSAHEHFRSNNRPWENYSDIWSERREDRESQKAIMRKVSDRAGGPAHYPADLYLLED